MNYMKIKKSAALFLIQASHLSATSTSNLLTTQDKKVNIINHNLNSILLLKNRRNARYNTTTHKNDISRTTELSSQINNLSKEIKSQIKTDRSIINYTSPSNNTPILINATHYGNKDIIKFLLEQGANIDATDKNGNSSLMRAVQKLQYGIIKLLLEHGANPTIKNINGETAIDIANKKLTKLNNEYSSDEDTKIIAKNPDIKATKETIRLLKDARRNLYIKRASWFLVAVLLVTLTGWGNPSLHLRTKNRCPGA